MSSSPPPIKNRWTHCSDRMAVALKIRRLMGANFFWARFLAIFPFWKGSFLTFFFFVRGGGGGSGMIILSVANERMVD